MDIEFRGKVFFWRGPSPYFFVTVPKRQSEGLAAIAPLVSYGWGMIPVTARIGKTTWTTALFPKDGLYLVPLKDAVREAEDLDEGDGVRVGLEVRRR